MKESKPLCEVMFFFDDVKHEEKDCANCKNLQESLDERLLKVKLPNLLNKLSNKK